MNNLLLFLAFPIATILLAIVLEKVLDSPVLVGMSFFAFYLVVTYAFFDSNFLLFAIIYTILAILTAYLVRFVRNCLCRICSCPEETAGMNVNLTSSNANSCQARNPRVITGRIQFDNTVQNGRNYRGR